MTVAVLRVDGVEHLVLGVERPSPKGRLTLAEREVLEQVHLGRSIQAVATRRGTTSRTVRKQLRAALAKLGLRSPLEVGARPFAERDP